MKEYLENKNCEICDSSKYKILYRWEKEHYSHQKFETCSWDGRKNIPLQIVKCLKCGLIYTRPSFKKEYLDLIYPKEIIPENISEKFKENKKSISLLNIIKNHKRKGVLLDIGTRYGVFPWFAKKNGFESYGIEYNKKSVKLGKKHFTNVFQGSTFNLLETIKNNELKKTDIVVMDDVLEHLVHPKKDLKNIHKILNDDGILVLRQMNYDSLGRKIFKKNGIIFNPVLTNTILTKNL